MRSFSSNESYDGSSKDCPAFRVDTGDTRLFQGWTRSPHSFEGHQHRCMVRAGSFCDHRNPGLPSIEGLQWSPPLPWPPRKGRCATRWLWIGNLTIQLPVRASVVRVSNDMPKWPRRGDGSVITPALGWPPAGRASFRHLRGSDPGCPQQQNDSSGHPGSHVTANRPSLSSECIVGTKCHLLGPEED